MLADYVDRLPEETLKIWVEVSKSQQDLVNNIKE